MVGKDLYVEERRDGAAHKETTVLQVHSERRLNRTMLTQAIVPPAREGTKSLSVVPGVHEGQPDPSIPRTVRSLFPAHSRAQQFLEGLLALADIEAGAPGNTRGAAAVVRRQGSRELSQGLHLAYETTHMYTLVFGSLGLLSVGKQEGQLTLILPLGPYSPPDDVLKTLDRLIMRYRSHRPKMRRLLETVTKRLTCLLGESTRAFQSDRQSVPTELIDRIQHALSSEGIRENTRQIAMGIAGELARFFPVENSQAAHLMAREAGENLPVADREGGEDAGRFAQHDLPEARLRVDSHPGESPSVACTEQETGRFPRADLPPADRVGEVASSTHLSAGELSETNLPLEADSTSRLSPFNGNGIGKKNITITPFPDSVPVPPTQDIGHMPPAPSPLPHPVVLTQARELAAFVEGHTSNLGAYVKIIRDYSLQNRLAALIALLVRKHFPQGRGPLTRPGGFFTRRCQQYKTDGTPDEFADLVAHCTHRSYGEIEEMVKTSFQHLASQDQRSLDRHPEAVPLKPRRGSAMDKATAQALAQRISEEDSYVQVKGVREASVGEERSYVVEVFIAPLDCSFASVEEWEDYYAQIQSLLDQEGVLEPGEGVCVHSLQTRKPSPVHV